MRPRPIMIPTTGKKALAQAKAWADWAVSHPKQAERDFAAQPKPVVFLPLMTKPASNPHDGKKYLPEMWKPNA